MVRKAICLIASPLLLFTGCSNEKKPNVVLFLVDDMGWTDLGCFGSDLYQTPNIDKLAMEGMQFTDAHIVPARCVLRHAPAS